MFKEYFNESWFFGDIGREEAQKLLLRQPLGTFLIRTSTKSADALAISLQGATCCQHALIRKVGDSYQYSCSKNFKEIHQFVQFYSENTLIEQQVLTHPVRKPQKIAKWNYKAQSSEELSIERGELLRFQYSLGDWAFCISTDTDKKGYVPVKYIDLFDPIHHLNLRPPTARNFYCHFLSAFPLPTAAHAIMDRKPNPFDLTQLGVSVGDYVMVNRINDDGICFATKGDVSGFLPLSCLDLTDLMNISLT